MPTCYLTIDDSPSPHTDEMIDFLDMRGIPSLLFVRGDMIDEHGMDSLIRAVKKGHILGNHSYSHRPFGELSYDEAVADIEKCDVLINDIYQKASVERVKKYFRFPYLDRGNGDRTERHFETVTDIDINTDAHVQRLQTYLHENGYIQPFKTNHPVYNNQSISTSADCLMTFTSFDWMISPRHLGKWDFKSEDDLIKRIDNDFSMKQSNGNIVLFHDKVDTFNAFKSLIDHMVDTGYDFLSIHN